MNRDEIARVLKAKGVNHPCPRCGTTAFTVIDGYANIPIQSELSSGMIVGGPSVPAALVACNNCGAITPHVLGPLGLLPESKEGGDA